MPRLYIISGCNGAGKTTITKLMMRLYDVTEGAILINGINIKEYRLDMLREKINDPNTFGFVKEIMNTIG